MLTTNYSNYSDAESVVPTSDEELDHELCQINHVVLKSETNKNEMLITVNKNIDQNIEHLNNTDFISLSQISNKLTFGDENAEKKHKTIRKMANLENWNSGQISMKELLVQNASVNDLDFAYVTYPTPQLPSQLNMTQMVLDESRNEESILKNPLEQNMNVNTLYREKSNEAKFIRIEKKLKSLSVEKEVKKLLENRKVGAIFEEVFDYFQWKLAKTGLLKESELLIGTEEEQICLSNDTEFNRIKKNTKEQENKVNYSNSMIDPPLPTPILFPFCDDESIVKESPISSQVQTSPIQTDPCEAETQLVKFEYHKVDHRSQQLCEKIEQEIIKIVKLLIDQKAPVLHVKSRNNWDNCLLSQQNTITLKSQGAVKYKKISFDTKKSEHNFTLVIFLLSEIYSLLITGATCSKRELFYHNPEFTENQLQVNMALNDISCILDTPLWELGVFSSSKGLIAGNLSIQMSSGCDLKCENGTSIPANIGGIKGFESSAKYLLIVEKDTVFKKLLDDNVFERMEKNFILITGKGYPDVNTRHLVKRLMDELSIPAYILVDADPYGMEIMFTYCFGSLALAHEVKHLASPTIKWIGIKPSDLNVFDILSMSLTESDLKKIDELLERSFVTDLIRHELEKFKKDQKKAEIEALYLFSPSFLVDQYLPAMIGMNSSL